MPKKLLDLRGKQSRIFRLRTFDKEGLVHVLFYRLLGPVSIVYGILLLLSLGYPPAQSYAKWFTTFVWALYTPQLYETVKAFSLISTRGLAHGRLNESFKSLVEKRYMMGPGVYRSLPYIVLAIWLVGFVLQIVWWAA
jgi:hypothetical protein